MFDMLVTSKRERCRNDTNQFAYRQGCKEKVEQTCADINMSLSTAIDELKK